MKVKIFNSVISTDDLENKISEWSKDINPSIISISVNTSLLHEYYHSDPSVIANQWQEYICVIIYS